MKVEQLKIRQQFEIQEQEVRRKRELAEAEMEANMAVVSYEIFQENEVQDTNEPIGLVLMKEKESKHSYKIHGRTGRGGGGGRRGRQPPPPPVCWANKASRAIFASQSDNIGLL